MKRFLLSLLVVCLSFGYMMPIQAEEIFIEDEVRMEKKDANSFYYPSLLAGTYDYGKANQVLKLVNQLRAKSGAKALVMDQEMCDMAMQRAAELYYLVSHYRPDGTYGPDIMREGSYSYNSYRENISYSYTSADQVMSFWASSSDHLANMVNPYMTVMGVGCVYINGMYYWCQIMRDGNCGPSLTSNATGNRTWTIRRVGTVDKVAFTYNNINVDIDGSYRFTIKYDGDTILDNSAFTWTSSNPEVVAVENGVLYPQNLGSATVSATYGNCTLKANVKVIFGDGWHSITGNWYYYENEVPIHGWKNVKGLWYYLDENGIMVNGLQTIDRKLYYFNPKGDMKTGWVAIDGAWYYFNSEAKDGWQKIDNMWYFFEDLKMVKGFKEINGKLYYLNSEMKTGWQNIDENWYYFNASGAALDGWQKINNKWYYFDDYKMQTGKINDNGKTYYLNDSGVMLTSGWYKEEDHWIYLETSTTLSTGWKYINSKWYYFDVNTHYMYSNRIARINGVNYFFESNGAMHTGWLETCGIWRYFDTNGKEVSGWKKINNKWYYFDPGDDNFMVSNVTMNINGKMYTFNKNGVWVQ